MAKKTFVVEVTFNLEVLLGNIKGSTVYIENNMTVQYIDWMWNLQKRK